MSFFTFVLLVVATGAAWTSYVWVPAIAPTRLDYAVPAFATVKGKYQHDGHLH